ncbi:hypothetical protein HCB17_10620 [Salinispora arenicola]|uniref:hypothetical protein n=1 Tax=Salinispora arenicola TaxID=168697 RepID=UPI001430A123|nr:hypothetical protein [Salinispora arenicola]NIL41577.1 hypothetical protein [Salinispora arenicola]
MHTDRTDRPGYSAEPRTREIKAGDLTAGMILRFADGESLTVLRVERDEDGIVLVTVDGDAIAAPYNAEETVTVVGWDGAVAPLAEPDYWQALAADLRAVADRLATLAGTPAPEVHTSLSLHVGPYTERGSGERRPVVAAIASALGGTAAEVGTASLWEYRAEAQAPGVLCVTAWTLIPAPEAPETAALRAEVAALRAQLAEGGAR